MRAVPPGERRCYAPDAVDFRLGFDGLFASARTRRADDPLCGLPLVFRNRTADRVTARYCGGHSPCLWCPWLEAGRHHFPEPEDASAWGKRSPAPFAMILDGIARSRVRRPKRFAAPVPV